MIPNKIYLGLEDVGSGYTWNISILDNGMEQYIRKDALLEWANEYMKCPEHSQFDTGFRCALKALIDKLNSM